MVDRILKCIMWSGLLTVEKNAIALCPNCHREAHYGTLVLKPTNIK